MSGTDLSEYESQTRKRFWLGPFAWLGWLNFHRATLSRLFADPRMSEAAKQAVREYL